MANLGGLAPVQNPIGEKWCSQTLLLLKIAAFLVWILLPNLALVPPLLCLRPSGAAAFRVALFE